MKSAYSLATGSQWKVGLLLALMALASAPQLLADGNDGVVWPGSAGVYFENNGHHDWVPLRAEQARTATMSAQGEVVQARLARGYSRATLYAPLKLAVRVSSLEDISGYRLYRLRPSGDAREVKFNKPIAAQWRELGPEVYELVLPENLPAGDYGILPPGEAAERVYAFRYEPLRLPRNQGFAFR